MLNPPFKRAASALAAVTGASGTDPTAPGACCEGHQPAGDAASKGRARLADLSLHLHCSVIGTCFGTPELRKLLSRFVDVEACSDLDVHHEAVRLAGEGAAVAKALHKALDQKHDAALKRFKSVRGAAALSLLWESALRQGEVPGAYWAVLTHRDVTPDLRQRVFGEVHMLSHLVGAANRADIRRLVALENENAELRDRLERQQLRNQQLADERDVIAARLAQRECDAAQHGQRQAAAPAAVVDVHACTAAADVQTTRRERAQSEARAATEEARRLQEELTHLQRHALAMSRELAVAEVQLREAGDDGAGAPRSLAPRLAGRRILYVGGRPSSAPVIRALVQRHGGHFQRHDGGMEDRKGLLESAVAWADLVLFPVDCVDHDSAGRLKRLCTKQGIPFIPLRSAGVASFAAAIADSDDTASPGAEARRPALCLRHG